MPSPYTQGTGYYDPNKSYGVWGNGSVQFDQTTLGDFYQNDVNPEGAFTRWLAEKGYGGFDNRADFGRAQYGRLVNSYGAAKTKNPDLKWTEFLPTIDLENVYQQFSPDQRNENPSNYAGRMRWQQR